MSIKGKLLDRLGGIADTESYASFLYHCYFIAQRIMKKKLHGTMQAVLLERNGKDADFKHVWWKCKSTESFWKDITKCPEDTSGFKLLTHPLILLLGKVNELNSEKKHYKLFGNM